MPLGSLCIHCVRTVEQPESFYLPKGLTFLFSILFQKHLFLPLIPPYTVWLDPFVKNPEKHFFCTRKWNVSWLLLRLLFYFCYTIIIYIYMYTTVLTGLFFFFNNLGRENYRMCMGFLLIYTAYDVFTCVYRTLATNVQAVADDLLMHAQVRVRRLVLKKLYRSLTKSFLGDLAEAS